MDNYKIIKFVNDDFEMDIIADKENETVWLSEEEIAKAFCEEETIIDKYIKSIFNNKELEENKSIIFLMMILIIYLKSIIILMLF